MWPPIQVIWHTKLRAHLDDSPNQDTLAYRAAAVLGGEDLDAILTTTM